MTNIRYEPLDLTTATGTLLTDEPRIIGNIQRDTSPAQGTITAGPLDGWRILFDGRIRPVGNPGERLRAEIDFILIPPLKNS